MIAIIVPVLGRPEKAAPLVENIRAATRDVEAGIYFVCSPSDADEIRACKATGATVLVVNWEPGPGDYARKINYGYRATGEPWIFTGADDLIFHPRWATAAFTAGLGAHVIGTNDLHNPRVVAGMHSTHTLVARSYANECGTVDGPGLIYHEGYDHQFCDDEMVRTAQWRGAWAFAREAHVEHLHPHFGGAEMDATYRKALAATLADSRLFQSRCHLWGGS